jgi:uncharacterized protein
MTEAMAMFPLGSVLVPGGILPLHVFEPRYRQLVEDCLANDVAEFGVTLISRGSEVGGGDQRTDVGTVARVVQVGRLPDGRYAVIAVGHRRVRVRTWMPDDPYPRAEVDDWPDDHVEIPDADWAELVDVADRRVRRVRALAVELGDMAATEEPDRPETPSLASHWLADRAPLGPTDVQVLLTCPDPVTRLRRLIDMLDDVETLLLFRLDAPDDSDPWDPGSDQP